MNDRPQPVFWIGLALGGAAMAFGIIGLLGQTSITSIGQIGGWVIGADLIHDLVIAPVACAAGLAITRWLPDPWRATVRAGSIATALVLAVGYPAWRGFGRHTAPGNPTVLPLDYTTAVLTVLGAVWTIVLIWTLCAILQKRSRPLNQ